MKYLNSIFIFLFLNVALVCVSSAAPPSTTESEISHLINFIRNSKLTFIRNDEEKDSHSAADHISFKYTQFKGKIHSTEEFIEIAASKSLLTGKPYLVKLSGNTQESVSTFLIKELTKFRNSNK